MLFKVIFIKFINIIDGVNKQKFLFQFFVGVIAYVIVLIQFEAPFAPNYRTAIPCPKFG